MIKNSLHVIRKPSQVRSSGRSKAHINSKWVHQRPTLSWSDNMTTAEYGWDSTEISTRPDYQAPRNDSRKSTTKPYREQH